MAFDANAPFFCVDNSDDALMVMIDRGLLGKLPNYDGLAPSHVAAFIDPKHPRHWLVACRFVGHTVKNVKSPYAVFGFLKSQFSIDEVNAFLERLVEEFGSSEPPNKSYPNPYRN